MRFDIICVFILCAVALGSGSGCRDRSAAHPWHEEARSLIASGMDPRPAYPAIHARIEKGCVPASAECEAIRVDLVDLYTQWGAFEQARSFHVLGSRSGVERAGKEMELLRRINPGRNGGSVVNLEEAEWGDRIMEQARAGTLTAREVVELCGPDEVTLPTLLALALITAGEHRAALFVAGTALRVARASLGHEWDGVDHGLDKGRNVTANSVILLKIYAISALKLEAAMENNMRGQDAMVLADSLHDSFMLRPDRSAAERAYLMALWNTLAAW